MSLLDDLQSIDLSGIVSAKASISVSIQAPGLQAALSGGAAQTALAGLGGSLGAVRTRFSSPQDLLAPLMEAVGAQTRHLDAGGLRIGELAGAVESGVGMIADPIKALSSDPSALLRMLRIDPAQVTSGLREVSTGFSGIDLGPLGRFRATIETLEAGVPSDPAGLARIAVTALIPFPGLDLPELRGAIDRLHAGIGAIRLPQSRTEGLVIALDGVAAAALTGDTESLRGALRTLEQVRQSTLGAIEAELYAVIAAIDGLRLKEILSIVTAASMAVRSVEGSILDFMERCRVMVAGVRHHVEEFDPAAVRHFLQRFIALADEFARREIGERVDEAAKKLQEFVRGLFADLPTTELRGEITAFFRDAARAIADANLDAVAKEIQDALGAVREKLDPAVLTADVQAALQTVRQAIEDALSGVMAALEQVSDAVNGVAGTAEGVLRRVSDALSAFKQTMASITVAVEGLGVREAAEQVVQTLAELREAAEKLLAVAPLPDSMRPTVEQLIDGLNSVDFDVVFKPVEDAAKQFQIPEQQKQAIAAALKKAADSVSNLIPDQLIADIEAEVKAALDTLTGFDPAALLPDVGQYLDEAAGFVLKLDPRPHVNTLRAPYQAVLDVVDRVHPRVLLAPAIEAYDSLMARIELPSAETFLSGIGDSLSAAVNRAGEAATSPLNDLISKAAGTPSPERPAGAPAANPPATSGTEPPEPPRDPSSGAPIRPGDLLRTLGFIPAKIREGVRALDAGAAGQALREIDALTAGLARDLRALGQQILTIETAIVTDLDAMLAPVSAAQLRAQVAVQGNFRADGITLNLALDGIAASGPATVKDSLQGAADDTRKRIRQALGAAGGQAAGSIDQLAGALERSRLASLTGDVDALLEALDPEPVALEVDALAELMFRRAPEILVELRDLIDLVIAKIEQLIAEFNPGIQAQKFLIALIPLKEQIDLLNPRRLADELGEVHAEIRKAIEAYDPAIFAAEIATSLEAIAAGIRALDPAALLGDLSFLDDIKAKIEAASPAAALEGVGAELEAVGKELVQLDPAALLTAIEAVGPRLVEDFKVAADGIRDEVVRLLEALKYGGASASASVSVSGSIG